MDNSNLNYLANPDGSVQVIQSQTQDEKETKNLGVFAEATFALTEAMRATLGARYDDTKVVVTEFFYDNPFSLCGTPIAVPHTFASRCRLHRAGHGERAAAAWRLDQ